jgi:hypothetical protein
MNRFSRHCLAGTFVGALHICPLNIALTQLKSPAEETAQGDLSIAIYSQQALVIDARTISLTAGRSRLEFPDVSAMIRPETLSFTAQGVGIVEQNFDYDLLTPSKLMEKATGQAVTLLRTNPATGVETRERAIVLSVAGGVVIRIGDRIEVLRDDGLPVRVIFDKVPANLRARPTLSVTVESARAGSTPVSIRYLTPGLGWSADYVALYDEGASTIDMQGWVTLTNTTGTTFFNAKTSLIAGNVNGGGRSRAAMVTGSLVRPGTQRADREQVGDFNIYPIAGRTTIADAQTKQISFLQAEGIAAQKIYSRDIAGLTSDAAPVHVASAIGFSSGKGGLGDALPAGTVRFYQRDRKGSPQFIGESTIDHTPVGSKLSLHIGDAFDILAQAEVEKREKISADEWEKSARFRVIEGDQVVMQSQVERPVTYYRTTMRYKLTNAKPGAVDVELSQSGLDRGWWSRDFRIVREDLPGEQINADQRKWKVNVPANGERIVRVVYETRY